MNDDEYAAIEGRAFLALILEGEAAESDFDEKDDDEITTWLEELGYQWNGASWVAC